MHSSDVYAWDKVLTTLSLPFWPRFLACALLGEIWVSAFICPQSKLGSPLTLSLCKHLVILISLGKQLTTFNHWNEEVFIILSSFPLFFLTLLAHSFLSWASHLLLYFPSPLFFSPSVHPSFIPLSFPSFRYVLLFPLISLFPYSFLLNPLIYMLQTQDSMFFSIWSIREYTS